MKILLRRCLSFLFTYTWIIRMLAMLWGSVSRLQASLPLIKKSVLRYVVMYKPHLYHNSSHRWYHWKSNNKYLWIKETFCQILALRVTVQNQDQKVVNFLKRKKKKLMQILKLSASISSAYLKNCIQPSIKQIHKTRLLLSSKNQTANTFLSSGNKTKVYCIFWINGEQNLRPSLNLSLQ